MATSRIPDLPKLKAKKDAAYDAYIEHPSEERLGALAIRRREYHEALREVRIELEEERHDSDAVARVSAEA